MEKAVSRLYERMAVACARLVAKTEPDGEGGFKTVLAVGDGFTAAIVRDSSTASRIAEHDGVRNVYTVTTDEPLRYGDLFQRSFDGQVFRCTSNTDDGAAPRCASFGFGQCSAEEWEVPDGD